MSPFFSYSGAFMCAVADGQEPGAQARLISLRLADKITSMAFRCMSFMYHAYGPHVGYLQILDDHDFVFWKTQKKTCKLTSFLYH